MCLVDTDNCVIKKKSQPSYARTLYKRNAIQYTWNYYTYYVAQFFLRN